MPGHAPEDGLNAQCTGARGRRQQLSSLLKTFKSPGTMGTHARTGRRAAARAREGTRVWREQAERAASPLSAPWIDQDNGEVRMRLTLLSTRSRVWFLATLAATLIATACSGAPPAAAPTSAPAAAPTKPPAAAAT